MVKCFSVLYGAKLFLTGFTQRPVHKNLMELNGLKLLFCANAECLSFSGDGT